ncbi:MAG TPA: DNA phosphorothioation system sulfurtransferase DndC, partial [Bacteroidales bacterium]|nr:DNA phosphorothioation system sulfurtransferase DndC [Bacteroidales bacterium]
MRINILVNLVENLALLLNMNIQSKVQHIQNEIVDQYLYDENDDRPWIIGFSGGKDSTALLQLVWNAIRSIPQELRKRDVYVVCNNTLVENPIIDEYVSSILKKIEVASREQSLPIFVKKTIPRLEDSFWVNLIGKGYPAPNNMFRWCTERLKIKPTSRYLLETVSTKGEAIILLGSRSAESSERAKSIKKHEKKGKRLSNHQKIKDTFLYSPIKHLATEEVWWYINTQPSPWDSDNSELFKIYSDASADDYECPTVVTNNNHTSCGQSRFGCWVCTVVKEDKSMTALIKNGLDWLKPLLDLRNSIVEERNKEENRTKFRRNGSEDSWGPYLPLYRSKLLEQVLLTQKIIQESKPHLELISNQELIAIQVIWNRDSIFNYKVSEIYNKVFKRNLEMKSAEKLEQEKALLKDTCKSNPGHFELIHLIKIPELSSTTLLLHKGHFSGSLTFFSSPFLIEVRTFNTLG